MARGLSPAFVITQASAHSNPSLGNEYKVVNWIRAAAIIDDIDPVATGYLMLDAKGNPRLPALRSLGDIDLANQGQTNLLVEYELHNLSDADFTFSIPAVGEAQMLLKTLAPRYGYDPTTSPSTTTASATRSSASSPESACKSSTARKGWPEYRRSWIA